jgi:hypothetical protein
MNRDDVIRMMCEAGMPRTKYAPAFHRLIEIAATAEREGIAEMVSNCDPRATPKGIAAAIRARGKNV